MVAGSKARSHGMCVRGDVQLLHGRITLYLAVHAVAGNRKISIRSFEVAKNIIEGTVLANDEEDMLQTWKGAALQAGNRVVADDGRCLRFCILCIAGGYGRDAAQFQLSNVSAMKSRIELAARVGAASFALGVGDINRASVWRDHDCGRAPTHG